MNNADEKTPEEQMRTLRAMSMPEHARAQMRDALSAYADFHSVPLRQSGRFASGALLYARARVFLRERHSYARAVLPLALILVLSSGTAYAAESSLPGTPLYRVKREINERVVGALAFSEKAKAKWHTRLLERRINEAESLADRHALDAGTETALGAEIAASVRDAVAQAQVLDESGENDAAYAVRTSVEASLRAHADILAAMEAALSKEERAEKTTHDGGQEKTAGREQDTPHYSPLQGLVKTLYAERTSVASTQNDARGKQQDGEHAGAQAALDEAVRAIYRAETQMSMLDRERRTNLIARAETRLAAAQKILASGQALYDAEMYEAARDAAERAALIAKEASVLASSAPWIRTNLDFSAVTPAREYDPHENTSNRESEDETRSDESDTVDMEK
jgi:hypothetical protein